MNFDPTSVIPNYPTAELEKILDLEKWAEVPMQGGSPVPPAPPAKSSGGGGGLAVIAGVAGLAVVVGIAVAMSRSKKGKR